MNNRNKYKALYINSIDISKSNGPGVNESEFIKHASLDKDIEFFFLLPKPINEVKWIKNIKNIKFLPQNTLKNPFKFIIFQFTMYKEIKKIVNSENINFILIRPSRLGIGAHLYFQKTKIPIFIKHFTFNTQKFFSEGTFHRFKTKIINLFDETIKVRQLKYSIGVEVVTEQIKNLVTTKYGTPVNKISVIPNSVNVKKFYMNLKDGIELKKELRINNNKKVIGYIGGFPSIRGGKLLIENAEEILEKYKNVHFLIVGMDDNLKQTINDLNFHNLKDKFTFAGIVPYDDVHKYFNILDIGIALDDPKRVKVVGNSNQKIRQYLASGVPVITNNFGTSFIKKNNLGIVIEKLNNENFVDAIIKLLYMIDLEENKIKERCMKYARENLSYQQSFEQMKKIWFSKIK